MLISYDPDEYETVYESRTCPFHQRQPDKSFAGCICSFGSFQKRRPPEEIAKIKADRLRKEEDDILAKAEIIKAKRASTDTMLGE